MSQAYQSFKKHNISYQIRPIHIYNLEVHYTLLISSPCSAHSTLITVLVIKVQLHITSNNLYLCRKHEYILFFFPLKLYKSTK